MDWHPTAREEVLELQPVDVRQARSLRQGQAILLEQQHRQLPAQLLLAHESRLKNIVHYSFLRITTWT